MLSVNGVLIAVRPSQLFLQQKRFKSKINIQKPRKPHYIRGVFEQFLTPFYENPNKDKSLLDLCTLKEKNKSAQKTPHPYHLILAREVKNWFDNSKMIAFLHRNSITQEEEFELAVLLRKENMYLKTYGVTVMDLALQDTPYKAVEMLYREPFYVIFSPKNNVVYVQKILKKFPQVNLMAGIMEGRLLSLNEFLRFGQMDLITVQASLVQVLQNAAGNNLNQQITHHQSTLVRRLRQIGTNEVPSNENDKSVPV